MTNESMLSRDTVIRVLIAALEPLDYVHAFWEGGAVAFNRLDEWSDIDLYLVVDDEKVEEAFSAVEEALASLSSIKQKYEVRHAPSLGLFQAFYSLEDTSRYHLIDLAVLKLSSPDKFLEPEIHGNARFYFNKFVKVRPPPLDRDAMVKKLKEGLGTSLAKFDMFNIFVQKEINRGNHIEAAALYHALTLSALVEALRAKYSPLHYDFKTRYIQFELPSRTTDKLKHLYFIRDEEDLQEKYRKATEWYREVISEIDREHLHI